MTDLLTNPREWRNFCESKARAGERVHALVNAVATAQVKISDTAHFREFLDRLRNNRNYAAASDLIVRLNTTLRKRLGHDIPTPSMLIQHSDRTISLLWGDLLTMRFADTLLGYCVTLNGSAQALERVELKDFETGPRIEKLATVVWTLGRGNIC